MKSLKNYKKVLLYSIFGITLFFGIYFAYKNNFQKSNSLGSRKVIETAMQIVREEKPTPIQSSRFYAIVATEYHKKNYDQNINFDYKNILLDFSTTSQRNLLKEIVSEDDANSEGFVVNVGEEFWNLTSGWTKENPIPFSPRAEKLSSFYVDESFNYKVPPPPFFESSSEYKKNLIEVRNAAERRTPEQGALVDFWGGIPGTEAPAGIWQNKFYSEIKNYNLTDKEYSFAQMILAQSLADSFKECWKVKFLYQTKRPDMKDADIPVAMPNPPFPSYVSGHSTISFTASKILGKLFPEKKDIFEKNAYDAKNSRLYAGIHFPYDNNQGQALGEAVGDFIIAKTNLEAIK
jgi:hypothetical protein